MFNLLFYCKFKSLHEGFEEWIFFYESLAFSLFGVGLDGVLHLDNLVVQGDVFVVQDVLQLGF